MKPLDMDDSTTLPKFEIPNIMSWDNALFYGKNLEQYFLLLLRKIFPSAVLVKDKFKYYDIWIPEIDKTIELKGDLKSNETDNLVIEVEHYNKPSGISTTKANYWVFFDGRFIWTEVDSLKQVIKSFTPVRFIGRGDTIAKQAYLVPKDMIIDISFKIWRFDER